MRRVSSILGGAALALVLAGVPETAWAWPCDFLTGGGWILRDSGAKANFGVGGGCKHGSPTWGHLNYIDHGIGLHVHWTSITAYIFVDNDGGPDPRTKQPRGARIICGTARTNHFGDVDFALLARDRGEPGPAGHLGMGPHALGVAPRGGDTHVARPKH